MSYMPNMETAHDQAVKEQLKLQRAEILLNLVRTECLLVDSGVVPILTEGEFTATYEEIRELLGYNK